MPDRDEYKDMPRSMQDIVSLIGREATLKLLFHHGGERFYVSVSTKDQIAHAIGQEAADTLVENYKRDFLELPHAKRAVAEFLFAQGWEKKAIQQHLQINRRTLARWFRGADAP